MRTAAPSREEVELENMTDEKRDIQKLLARPYKFGFKTIIESDTFPKARKEAERLGWWGSVRMRCMLFRLT
jgi:hypothetical protein